MSHFVDGTTYIVASCGADGCGLTFGMPEHFYDKTHRTKETWYCPQGHGRVWRGETHQEELRRAKAQNQAMQDQLDAAARDAERLRGEILRDRERFANGVCPACSRSFQNVRHHMASQHPNYDTTHLAVHDLGYRCSCGKRFASIRGLHIHQGRMRQPGWSKPDRSRYRAHLTEVAS